MRAQETYTDFEEEAAQYAAFYFRLAPELIRQRRSRNSLFGLLESWGAMAAFLYLVFGLTARQYNQYHFSRQVGSPPSGPSRAASTVSQPPCAPS